MREAGATDLAVARTPEERTAQWEARHHVYWALVNMHPGHVYVITDTAVPLARLPESIAHAQQLLGEMGLNGSILGHVGDGNFHTLVAVPPEDYARAHAFARATRPSGAGARRHGVGRARHRAGQARLHGGGTRRRRGMDAPAKGALRPEGL